jgi:SAM-dependent methyltransferase
MSDDRQSSKNQALFQQKYLGDASRLHRIAMSRFYRALDHMLNQVQAEVVFDAGCGEGHIMSRVLEPRFPHSIGADLDHERIAYVRATYPQYQVFCGNLHHIPLPDNSVDLAICLEVFEHVGQPERALSELHRVTKRFVLLSVPNEPFWRIGNMLRGAYLSDWGNTPEHINHWSVWGFKRFVRHKFRLIDSATPFTWTMVLAEKTAHSHGT